MYLYQIFLVQQNRLALRRVMLNIPKEQKVIERIYIGVLDLFDTLGFGFLLKLEEDRLSLDKTL